MAEKKLTNREIKEAYDRMAAEQRDDYYGSFLREAKQSFKKYYSFLLWVGFLIAAALLSMIPVTTATMPLDGAVPRNGGPIVAVICILLSAACVFAAFFFKLNNKIAATVFFALNIIGISVVAFITPGGINGSIKEGAWAILFVINLAGVILTLIKSKKTAGTARESRLRQGFAAVLILSAGLSFQNIKFIFNSHLNLPQMMDVLPITSLIFFAAALVLFILSVYPHGMRAFKLANTCKAIKGARLDGTKKIFWCTLYPVINAYSMFIFITLAALLIGLIMAGVVGANNPRRTATVRITYTDGVRSFYTEGEYFYDEQNRQIGRVINGRVYDNNMNQTGYISDGRILPL